MSRSFVAMGSSTSAPHLPPPSFDGSILTIVGAVAIPIGLLLFGIGFAIHGMKSARSQERIGELEQLTQAMDEEISRLKAGAPRA